MTVPTGPTLDHADYLGASDMAAVVGLSPWKTALDVWAEKRRLFSPTIGPQADIGRELERPILERIYAPRYGVGLTYPGTIQDPTEPWIAGTPDAIEDGAIVVELKVVGRRQMPRWGDESEGEDGIPVEVYCQNQWQMRLMEMDGGRVVALLGTDLLRYTIPRDQEFIDGCERAARDFWYRCVVGGEMPKVEGRYTQEILSAYYPEPKGDILPMEPVVAGLTRQYLLYKEGLGFLERESELLANKLRATIGERRGFEGEGLRVTWGGKKRRVLRAKFKETA